MVQGVCKGSTEGFEEVRRDNMDVLLDWLLLGIPAKQINSMILTTKTIVTPRR